VAGDRVLPGNLRERIRHAGPTVVQMPRTEPRVAQHAVDRPAESMAHWQRR
jgi:hypothetical protein